MNTTNVLPFLLIACFLFRVVHLVPAHPPIIFPTCGHNLIQEVRFTQQFVADGNITKINALGTTYMTPSKTATFLNGTGDAAGQYANSVISKGTIFANVTFWGGETSSMQCYTVKVPITQQLAICSSNLLKSPKSLGWTYKGQRRFYVYANEYKCHLNGPNVTLYQDWNADGDEQFLVQTETETTSNTIINTLLYPTRPTSIPQRTFFTPNQCNRIHATSVSEINQFIEHIKLNYPQTVLSSLVTDLMLKIQTFIS